MVVALEISRSRLPQLRGAARINEQRGYRPEVRARAQWAVADRAAKPVPPLRRPAGRDFSPPQALGECCKPTRQEWGKLRVPAGRLRKERYHRGAVGVGALAAGDARVHTVHREVLRDEVELVLRGDAHPHLPIVGGDARLVEQPDSIEDIPADHWRWG